MIVGCLGEIAFVVSSEEIKTIENVSWSGSAKYATHERHGANAITEFVGINPDKISFTMKLSAYLGVNPINEISKIFEYERNGTAVNLVIGDKVYGKYKWNVVSHSVSMTDYLADGSLAECSVSVSLQEYIRR